MDNKISQFIQIVSFLIIILTFTVISFIKEPKLFSQNENRILTQKPKVSVKTVLDGTYQLGYEEYLLDQFPGRDNWISVKTYTELIIGKKEINNVYFGREGYLFNKYTDVTKEQFNTNLNNVTSFVSKYESILGEDKVKVMIIPTKEWILKDKLPSYSANINQKEITDYIGDSLGKSFIKTIDILEQHRSEYIYYKTDHHWTTLGAFYGYTKWANYNGIEPYSIEDFQIQTVAEDFSGTIYSKVNVDYSQDQMDAYMNLLGIEYQVKYNGTDQIIDTLYNTKALETKDKYNFYLNGNNGLVHISTNVNNNQKLLIIKDSYANAFVPFIANHYSQVYVVDLRYYKGSIEAFVQQNEITDVLVLYNLISFMEDKDIALINK